MSSVPAPPDLAAGDGDFRAAGWSDQPAATRTPAVAQPHVAADTPPAQGAGAAVTAAWSPSEPGDRQNAGTEVPATRSRVRILVIVLLELVAAGGALALAAAVWEVRAHTHVLSGLPIVGELPSALFWLSVSLGVFGSALALLVWPTCRGGLWARRVIMVVLMTGALPGLLAGILPGAAMVLAVVLLARPDVRAHFASRRGGTDGRRT